MAERLDFNTDSTPYNSVLAAEHLARYAAAARFAKGKRVLDLACGEGYGAAFMKDHGAKTVLGVDISEDAIATAGRLFSRDDVEYRCADALDPNSWNPARRKFDLIACFETIEHVSDPKLLLTVLKQALAPNGTILISCPNDAIENSRGVSNPFHLNSYSLADFQQLATDVLGEADQWLIGTPLTGITVVEADARHLSNTDSSIKQLNNSTPLQHSLLLPVQPEHKVTGDNATFYLGIWRGQMEPMMVGAPWSKSAFLDCWYTLEFLKLELAKANDKVQELCQQVSTNERMLKITDRRLRSQRKIAAFEIDALKARIFKLKQQAPELHRVSYDPRSRAHRLAALYTRSATGSNPAVKFWRLGKALWGAAMRRLLT
jgi:SAM-dependent methyltransferase